MNSPIYEYTEEDLQLAREALQVAKFNFEFIRETINSKIENK